MKILSTPRMEQCIGCHSCSLACARLMYGQLPWDKAGIRIRSTGGLSTGFESQPCPAGISGAPATRPFPASPGRSSLSPRPWGSATPIWTPGAAPTGRNSRGKTRPWPWIFWSAKKGPGFCSPPWGPASLPGMCTRKMCWQIRMKTGFDPEAVPIPDRFKQVVNWRGPLDADYLVSLQKAYAQRIREMGKTEGQRAPELE